MRRRVLSIAFFLLALPGAAIACRCLQLPFADYFERAEFVAMARLTMATELDDRRRLDFELMAAPYKGGTRSQLKGSVVTLSTELSTAACGIQPDLDAIYIVFAETPDTSDGQLWINSCNGTRVHLSSRLDEPVGFVDVPARFVAGQLNAYFGLDVLRDVSAHAPLPADAGNDKLVGLLDLKALAHGGVVSVRSEPDPSAALIGMIESFDDVESKEYAYEQPGAVVFATHAGWYRVRLADARFGWVAPEHAGTWFPYEHLPLRRLAYLTDEWSGLVWPDAGAGIPVRKVLAPGDARQEYPVDVLESIEIGGTPWFRVEVLGSDPCSGEDARPGTTGWVPAYGRHGEPNIWFYSRGC